MHRRPRAQKERRAQKNAQELMMLCTEAYVPAPKKNMPVTKMMLMMMSSAI